VAITSVIRAPSVKSVVKNSASVLLFCAFCAFLRPLSVSAEPRETLRIHDPSTPVRADNAWWIFGTGKLLKAARSSDLRTWETLPSPLSAPPVWAAEIAPKNKEAFYWAPDVIRIGDLYHLYYSVSEFGQNHSAIGLATSPTLDPKKPGYGWTDRGIVIRSGDGDRFNAIDASTLATADNHLWMAFGSFWDGIFIVELDPKTGLRIAPDTPLHRVAYCKEIEAPFLYQRGDYFYLFFNQGLCCRGKDSTYTIKVGRSRSVTGPYLDDQGRDCTDKGGRPVLGTKGDFIGPGHAGIIRDPNGREWLTVHFYDGAHNGAPTFARRALSWTVDAWPRITD
jgi:arabinan endo-1,5-alpha-L-arabinosidase